LNKKKTKKYIFITGGVASSLGKGLAAASLAALLERRGIKINMLKMDPYINVDPGTMSPIQHGEVFVTEDGAETDLDLGHYERFTSLRLTRKCNFTTGQVYMQVIENEREGRYLGKTVQVVPHITNEIKRRIHLAADDVDLLIGEIGGTVGDIESLPFLESIRQFSLDVGQENVLFIHLVLLPYISAAGELKSKPGQHSVKELRSIGLFPQMIILRSDRQIESSILNKISLFCNIPKESVFHSIDCKSIYQLPLSFYQQGVDHRAAEILGIWSGQPNMDDLLQVVHHFENPLREVRIGIVGKYTELVESYKSLDEAMNHGAIANQVKLVPVYIDAEEIERCGDSDSGIDKILGAVDGILVPGGFGARGTEGKIRAVEYARVNQVPFLGICLGLQVAIIEFARNVVGIEGATSAEFEQENNDSVIHYMEGQSQDGSKGGSMRLGGYPCSLKEGSLAHQLYGKVKITERHRHRLEVNNDYVDRLAEAGMVFSGINSELDLVEIIELVDHPYFVACQFHPEFISRPFAPHPMFERLIRESLKGERS
jgi:CTP synthase